MLGVAILFLTICLTCTVISVFGVGGLAFFIFWVWPYPPQILDVGLKFNSVSVLNSSNTIVANITVNFKILIEIREIFR
jgi:hypothetical protein